MYRVWFKDLEKAVAALREVVKDELFYSISGNAYGDFVFKMDDDVTYIVKHLYRRNGSIEFHVWRNFGAWKEPDWREILKGE